jgi:hypothetical protein
MGRRGKRKEEKRKRAAWKKEEELGQAENGEKREGKVEGFVFQSFSLKPFSYILFKLQILFKV